MRHDIFIRELRKAFDERMELRRDPGDDCMVVWDKTRGGEPYPVIKLAHEHCKPFQPGTPREGYDQDILAMRRMDWSERYNYRRGAAQEIMEQCYYKPARDREWALKHAVTENTEQNMKPYLEWRTGTRFHVGFGKSAGQSTGSFRAKDGIERARKRDHARGRGDRWA